MKLSSLILTVTEDCNFRCKYCYQARSKHYMSWETAKQTLDFFLPRMKKNHKISFLGGEPFLAFDLIKKAVAYVKLKNKELSKSAGFAVSTNGSLLAEHVLDFLNRSDFIVELSFDGFVQDAGRKKNSFAKTVAVIENALALKNISLGTNSTFTAATVGSIHESL
ncbi:MAG: radical SAM protein, partial [Candidatus Aminicenantes bacterium]|nr:radical SAM protein [Candidatus Aminicenantes bacterium]